MIRVGIHVKTQEVMVLMNMMNIWMMKVQEKIRVGKQKGNAPRSNQKQNKQFRRAVKS